MLASGSSYDGSGTEKGLHDPSSAVCSREVVVIPLGLQIIKSLPEGLPSSFICHSVGAALGAGETVIPPLWNLHSRQYTRQIDKLVKMVVDCIDL